MANESDFVRLPEGDYAKYLAVLAAEIADEKTRHRDARWRAALGALFTGFAVLGYVNISSIATDLENRLANRIPSEVKAYVDGNRSRIVGDTISELQTDLEARMALLQLVIVASELREGDSFTNETRSAVVSLLANVSSNAKLVDSPQFAKPLEDIVDAFLAADQEMYIDDIDEKLREVVSKRDGITTSMLQHYGLRVLGSTELDDNEVKRFKYYAQIATHTFNSPHLSAPFLLGLVFIEAGMKRDPLGTAIFADARHWKPKQRVVFSQVSQLLSAGKFYTKPTGKTDRVVALMKRVREGYRAEFDELEASVRGEPELAEMEKVQELLRLSDPKRISDSSEVPGSHGDVR